MSARKRLVAALYGSSTSASRWLLADAASGQPRYWAQTYPGSDLIFLETLSRRAVAQGKSRDLVDRARSAIAEQQQAGSARIVQSALDEQHRFIRRLPSGEWAAISQFLFTTGLIVGLSVDTYRVRYCYKTAEEARKALFAWDGAGDPPGAWIKAKGLGVDRPNPAFRGIEVVST